MESKRKICMYIKKYFQLFSNIKVPEESDINYHYKNRSPSDIPSFDYSVDFFVVRINYDGFCDSLSSGNCETFGS